MTKMNTDVVNRGESVLTTGQLFGGGGGEVISKIKVISSPSNYYLYKYNVFHRGMVFILLPSLDPTLVLPKANYEGISSS